MREFDGTYLLRVWRDGRGDDAWRASLKDLRSQEVVVFRGLDALVAHFARIGAAERDR